DRPVFAADIAAVPARLAAQVQAFSVATAFELCRITSALQELRLAHRVAPVGVEAVAAAGVRQAKSAQKAVGIADLTSVAAIVFGLPNRTADGGDAALQP